MADHGVEADDLGRLEAALDRIAAHAARDPIGSAAGARLDRLIGQLQDALSGDPAPSSDPALTGDPALAGERMGA